MSRRKPKFGEGDVLECRADDEYGSVERYLVYGYSEDWKNCVVLKVTDCTKCRAGIEDCDVEPDLVDEKYLEKFGKKIGFIDLSIFMDGTD